jgi:hypothetical protein
MALTKQDLTQIRTVMDDAIAEHPRFDQLKTDIIDEMSDVYRDGLELIDKRFDVVEERFGRMEKRIDGHERPLW